jgi:hypothetical protein
MLIRPANIGGNYLQNDRMRSLLAHTHRIGYLARYFELRILDILHRYFARALVNNYPVVRHNSATRFLLKEYSMLATGFDAENGGSPAKIFLAQTPFPSADMLFTK